VSDTWSLAKIVRKVEFKLLHFIGALKRVREDSSSAPLGLFSSHVPPRLAPWAAFLRRFAVQSVKLCSTVRQNF
jgi:hypothetical protein